MTTSPSSGLSPEAKEFVPLVQTPVTSIPLYVDENTIASIYSADQQPLMVQTIYPMMMTNSKVTETTANNNLQFPEIEFHIQPSQQQQFHIDSCTNIQQHSSTNGNSSTNNTSQIVLLPTTNTAALTSTGYYAGAQIIYSTNEQTSAFYPMDYCEQPLINFSLQQPTQITKSNRISSQHQRPTSFRQQRGTNHSSYRPSSRGGNNNNPSRNSYYDYNNRRPCSSYTQNPTRGNSLNSKRISSSYHQHDYNNYYHNTSSRSRGYSSRSSQQHDEQRKENFDYYNHEKDLYENDYHQSSHLNDDGTPFEFRPEDFPSLPINNPQSDKTPPQSIISTNTKSASSWNEIVSAPRPHSTSPHSIPPSSIQSQDSRSDRSRSFNNKISPNNERRSSNNNTKQLTSQPPPPPPPPHRASTTNSQEEQQYSQILTNNDQPITENNIQDDGFIQTKQQQRRLKRKNKIKEESTEQSIIIESAPFALDDENAFPTLGQQASIAITNKKSENDSTIKDNATPGLINKANPKSNQTHQVGLNDMFNALSTSTQNKQQNSHNKTSAITTIDSANPLDSKPVTKREQPKSRKPTKLKRVINQELEENQKQRQPSFSKATVEKQSEEKDIQNETDTTIANVTEKDYQNSNPLSSSSNNSSDTSDYDDAVDNLDDE